MDKLAQGIAENNPQGAMKLAQVELLQQAELLAGLAVEMEEAGFTAASVQAVNRQASLVQRLSFNYAARFRPSSAVIAFRPRIGGLS